MASVTSESARALNRRLYIGLASAGRQVAKPVGLLKLAQHGNLQSGQFAYGRHYLLDADAQPLNPDHLPLRQAPFELVEARLRDGGALPLTMRDALPDTWGRKVLEIQHGPLSDVDALLLTNEDRVGAMVFSEALPIASEPPSTTHASLAELAKAAMYVEAGLEVTPEMHRLLRGGSLGGARPKSTFIHEGRRHLVKFAARGDEVDVELVEATMLGLAASCGIAVPRFFVQRLAAGHALVLERFDRAGSVAEESRFHYLSAAAIMNAPYDSNRGSYVELAQCLRRLSSRAEQDLTDLYRRLVFNLVVGNTDDHVKNHGLLHEGRGSWRLAPAFDLVPQLAANVGLQGMAILPGQSESRLALAREAAPHFGFDAARAEQAIAQISERVDRDAEAAVIAAGGTARLARRLKTYLDSQADRIRS